MAGEIKLLFSTHSLLPDTASSPHLLVDTAFLSHIEEVYKPRILPTWFSPAYTSSIRTTKQDWLSAS